MNMNLIQEGLIQSFKKFGRETAIEYRNQSISYSELDEISDRIFNYMIDHGIKEGAHIALHIDDKFKLICAIAGILKARCVFVPLDVSYPVKRLKKMIAVSDAELLFVEDSVTGALLGAENGKLKTIGIDIVLDQKNESRENNPYPNYQGDDKIYIYFTSGTTGEPKAILGRNSSLAHFIDWEIKTFDIRKNCRISQFTPQCHDPFLRDIFTPLMAGGTICIPESKDRLLSSVGLIHWIEKSRVNLIHCTPSLFRVFNAGTLSADHFKCLRFVLLAGERIIPNELVNWYRIFKDRIQLVNLYGPTETTLAKMFYVISEADTVKNNIPVGKPMDGCKVTIIDEQTNICRKGEIGEIIIRTKYRTKGYYKDPDLTKKKFIQNPFSPAENDIVYKTGDLGRFLPDGNIELLGRADDQVKIRGFRVEISEIENTLAGYPGITKCAVKFNEANPVLPRDLSRCTRCGIPASFPDISLDETGQCNICHFFSKNRGKTEEYWGTIGDLAALLEQQKNGSSPYDCMMLFSGGKDSSYAIYKLVNMGFNVLAYTFDNGFISKEALKNIKTIVDELNVDHIIDTYPHMEEIFKEGLNREYSVCNGCFKVLRTLSTKLAYEQGINYIVTGFSRGQIYDLRLYELYKQSIFDKHRIEQKILEQRLIYHNMDDYIRKNLGEELYINPDMLREVELVDFYRYDEVTGEEIINYLKKRSSYWSIPADTGFCSSNCLINDLGIYFQRNKLGFDNYTFPTSWEVRLGHIDLEDAQKKYGGTLDLSKVYDLLNEMNYQFDHKNYQDIEGYITAYYISDVPIDDSKLRKYLSQSLPDYMVPSYFLKLDKMPVTSSGKLNYKKLPDPKLDLKREYLPPTTETERALEKIWCEILGTRRVGISENFLNIGGHSLKVMALITRIFEEFEVDIPLKSFFEAPNIKAVAEYLDRCATASPCNI